MALSNIFREPRREITESALGIGALAIVLYPDYRFAIWLQAQTIDPHGNFGCPWPLGMIVGFICLFFFGLVLFTTHSIGEGICNFLARHGAELRPKQRRR